MSVGRYVLGAVALCCVLGSYGAGAAALRSLLVPDWRGAPARLAELVLGLGLLIVTGELLGAVGLFKLAPILVASVVIGLGLALRLGSVGAEHRSRASVGGRRLAAALVLVLSLLAAGVVLAEWAGPTLQSYGRGIIGADSVSYHMPWAASFAQTGQVTGIRYTDIQYLTGFYPATSELLHAFGIVLMGNDVLSPGLNFVWLALVLLAAWCVGHPRGVGPATLLAGAVVMGAPMMFFSTAGSADNDVVGVFFLLAAVALWINAGTPVRTDGRAPGPRVAEVGSESARGGLTSAGVSTGGVLLTAIAAGLAVSVKLNLLAPVAVLSAAVIMWAPGGLRRRVTGIWIAGLAPAGGFWYVRNLIVVGNPLPFFSFGFLPTPQPPPLQHNTNYSIVSYLHYPRIFHKVFAPAIAMGLGPWWVEILAAAVVGATLCVIFGPDRLVRLVGCFALVSLAAYLVTPGSASGPWGNPRGFYFNLRYAAPALTVALAAGPLAAPLSRKYVRLAVVGGLAAIFLATVAQKRLWSPGYNLRGDIAAAALVLAAGSAVIFVPWSRLRAQPFIGRVGLATLIATLLFAGVAAGYRGQRHYSKLRYTQEPGLSSISRLWKWARTVQNQPIAFAGTFGWYFGYPIFGPDDSNRVQYMGHHGSHGSFTTIRSCREWRRAVNAGHFRYVVTSASRTMWTGAVRSSPEGAWTEGDPAVRLLSPPARNSSVEIYEVAGRLNPARC